MFLEHQSSTAIADDLLISESFDFFNNKIKAKCTFDFVQDYQGEEEDISLNKTYTFNNKTSASHSPVSKGSLKISKSQEFVLGG